MGTGPLGEGEGEGEGEGDGDGVGAGEEDRLADGSGVGEAAGDPPMANAPSAKTAIAATPMMRPSGPVRRRPGRSPTAARGLGRLVGEPRCDRRRLATDRWYVVGCHGSRRVLSELMEDGATCVPIGQGLASLSGPTHELVALPDAVGVRQVRTTSFGASRRGEPPKPVPPGKRADSIWRGSGRTRTLASCWPIAG